MRLSSGMSVPDEASPRGGTLPAEMSQDARAYGIDKQNALNYTCTRG